MPGILYAAIAQQRQIVCHAGNTKHRRLGELIVTRAGNINRAYEYEDMVIYFAPRERHNRAYMCVADKDFDGRICFAFLETIRTKYNFALQNGGQDSFDGELGSQMMFYSSTIPERVKVVQSEAAKLKPVMLEDLTTLLRRNETIEDALLSKTTEIATTSFAERTRNTLKSIWWKNTRLWVILGVILMILIIVIAFRVCNVDFSACESAADSDAFI